MKPLALALLELPARFGQKERVLSEVDALVAKGPADLVLLPEAAITGYVSPEGDFDLGPLAEERGGATETALAAIAKRHRVHLAAPLIEREGRTLYNAFLVFDREGAIVATYRKRHPWYPEEWATPGATAPPVFSIEGRKVTIAICFDVHTLAEEAAAELSVADLLLFPSAWVEDPGDDLRESLLSPIAKRFGVVIANANWAAGDVVASGQGSSRVYGRDGARIATTGSTRLDAVV